MIIKGIVIQDGIETFEYEEETVYDVGNTSNMISSVVD